jgi:hypothetical protein
VHAPEVLPLVIGVLVGAATVRTLVLGAASASGDDITRREEPLIYWTAVVAGALAALFLIWTSFRHS